MQICRRLSTQLLFLIVVFRLLLVLLSLTVSGLFSTEVRAWGNFACSNKTSMFANVFKLFTVCFVQVWWLLLFTMHVL